jgi:hypothetical protein
MYESHGFETLGYCMIDVKRCIEWMEYELNLLCYELLKVPKTIATFNYI